MSCRPNKQFKFKDINIPGLIAKQRQAISGILNQALDELKKQEQAHKEKFKDESLAGTLGKNQRYIVSKVWESIHSDRYPASLGLMHIELIQKSLESFKQALEKRDLWGVYESIKYIYEELQYPIGEVEKYFRGEDVTASARKRAEVNFFFIDRHFEELQQIAKEIEEDYNTKQQKKRRKQP